MARDVTEQREEANARRAAEAALHASEARAAAMIATAPDAILTFDGCYVIIEANPAATRLFQCTLDDLIGRDVRMLFVADDRSAYLGAPPSDRDPLAEGTRDGRAMRNDGTLVPVRLAVGGANIGADRLYTAIVHDLSERLLFEQRLQQAAKMEAMGKLAGGVAHDFNNLLTVINGYAAELLLDLPEGAMSHEFAKEIGEAGSRAASLTRQLLAMARSRTPHRGHVSLNEIVHTMTKMLGRLIGEDVRLVVDLAEDTAPVEGDVGQLEQVLLNLCVNGARRDAGRRRAPDRDADRAHRRPRRPDDLPRRAPPGRHLCRVDGDRHGRRHERDRAKPHLRAVLHDEGLGPRHGPRPRDGRRHREPGGGHIAVDTAEGKGTRFRVYIPAAVVPSVPAPHPAALEGEGRGTEVVLLAEDDDSVRALARFTLESRGYTVLEASDGETAAHLAQTHAGAIHLLVTDVVMPGLAGPALGDALRVDRPNIKVLYCSGYGSSHPPEGDEEVQDPMLPRDASVLPKPFTPSELAARVRALLDGRSPGAESVPPNAWGD